MTEASLSTFNSESPFSSEQVGLRGRLFFRQAVVFHTAVVLLACVTDLACGFFLSQNYDFKPSFVVARRPSADIVFLGSSRAVHMMDPRVIEQKTLRSAYNLGVNAGSLDEQITMLRLYRKYNRGPRALCIEFTPEYLEGTRLHFHPFMFVNHLDDADIFQAVRRHAPRLAWLRFVPLAKYGLYNKFLLKRILGGALQFFWGSREGIRLKGYEPTDEPWDGTYEAFLQEHPGGDTIEADPAKLKSLEDLIAIAKASSEEVIFYEAPILAESLPWSRNRDEMLQKVRKVFARHGVPYVNFQDLPISRSRRWFINSRHLNRKGTTVFSEVFAEFLKQRLSLA